MSKIFCMICSTPCVWCAKKCKCWLNTSQVTMTNSIITKHSLQNNPEVMFNLIRLAKKNIPVETIEWLMYSTPQEIEDTKEEKEIKKQTGYCEFPTWSASRWQWVECIHCWKPRFKTQWKLCESLIAK